jgi:GxxExxY protein
MDNSERALLYKEAIKKYKDRTFQVIGAALEVHGNLGCGFMEAVYEEAFRKELEFMNIPFEEQKTIPIYYKGELLNQYYVADFVCYGDIIVELKAVSELQKIHEAQVINYLKATGFEVGLLFNFGSESLEKKRFFNIYHNSI